MRFVMVINIDTTPVGDSGDEWPPSMAVSLQ